MNGQSEWYIDPGDCTMVLDGPDCNHGNTIARCPTAEDAAQIVCEHNSHAALVAACRAAHRAMAMGQPSPKNGEFDLESWYELERELEAALAATKE